MYMYIDIMMMPLTVLSLMFFYLLFSSFCLVASTAFSCKKLLTILSIDTLTYALDKIRWVASWIKILFT
jgi:hypothetical protein